MVVAMVANVLQFGFLFRLPHNEDALDIGKGIERLFSTKSRAKVLIDVAKLIVVTLIGWSLVRQCADQIVSLQQLDASASFAAGMALVFGIVLRISVLLLTLGALDYGYQRWRHERELRMTPREIKDELRQMEGDPTAKRNRRLFSNSLVSSRSERAVATANVLIMHENQLAIAIRYDKTSMPAPRVVAKAAGATVSNLRAAASVAGVAIVEQEVLARTLDRLASISGEIPSQLYTAVAEVLAFAAASKQGGER
jgi:flagellar biosynthetic protein FlhB